MSNEILPFEGLTIQGGVLDAVSAATRKGAIKSDIYEGKDQFIAVILKPLTTGTGFTQEEVAGQVGTEAPDNSYGTNGKIYGFKVRIVSANSPHAFLPEPCFDTTNAAINGIIQDMHTTALSREGNYSDGDEVYVQLEKTDFSYNLDSCWIIGPTNSNQGTYSSNLDCLTTKSAFGNKTISEFYVDLESALKQPGIGIAKPYALSTKGTEDLKGSEGGRGTVYDDYQGEGGCKSGCTTYDPPEVKGYPTIGIGHKIEKDERARFQGNLLGGTPLTEQEIEDLFSEDVNPRVKQLNKYLGDAEVTQEMYDALFSLGFNLGMHAKAMKAIYASIKSKDYVKAANLIAAGPDTSKGVNSAGLRERRQKEAHEFASGGTPSSS